MREVVVAGGLVCPKCGTSNELRWKFCVKCGESLEEAPAGQVAFSPAPPQRKPEVSLRTPSEGWRPGTVTRKEIDRTQTGLVLVIISLLTGWIPDVGLFALFSLIFGILGLAGVILVILGRVAFGRAHERNVLLSVVVYVTSVVVALVGVLMLAEAFLAASRGGSRAGEILVQGVDGAFSVLLAAVALVFLAWILLVYVLVDKKGLLLLVAAGVTSVGGSAGLWGLMRPALAAAGSSGDLVRAFEAVDQFVLFGTVLTLVSNLLFAAALYTAWRRIYRQEIPPPPASAFPRLVPASFAPSFAPSPALAATPRAAPSTSSFKECRSCGTVLDRTVTACAVCGAPA